MKTSLPPVPRDEAAMAPTPVGAAPAAMAPTPVGAAPAASAPPPGGSVKSPPAPVGPRGASRIGPHASGFLVFLLLLSGCTAIRPLKGGHAITSGPVHQSLTQSENPSVPTRQSQETIRTRTYTLPPGSRIEQPATTISPIQSPETHKSVLTPLSNIQLSAPTAVVEREETRAATELGAAQKDTARELGAKLTSLKGIVWVGVVMFAFGLASIVWPPLKAIIGSVTTSAAITAGGIALMVLPTLIVGNELLILGAVTVAVGAWFIAHRHGHFRGQVANTRPTAPTKTK